MIMTNLSENILPEHHVKLFVYEPFYAIISPTFYKSYMAVIITLNSLKST